MNSFVNYAALPAGIFLASALFVACSSVQEQAASKPTAPAPAAAKAEAAKATKTKVVDVQGVISSVGQRTITFQMERKGKVREEVVGVDDKTKIEKNGANVKLRDLEVTDQAMINYVPEAYTPAIAIKVTGKGKIKKKGGDD
jgi:DNA-binding helix-hairpin-helix protein with protein kinase domain